MSANKCRVSNPFGVLCDDAIEELSYNKKLAKAIIKSEQAVVKADLKPKKKPAAAADASKKPNNATSSKTNNRAASETKPEAKRPEPAPASTAATAAAPSADAEAAPSNSKVRPARVVAAVPPEGAAAKEVPARAKLLIQRPSDTERTTGSTHKREFDRRSGTGRGREQRKDGAGRANWGSDRDEIKAATTAAAVAPEAPQAAVNPPEGEAPAAAEVAAAASPADATTEPKPEEPKPAPIVEKTLDEFLQERKKLGKKAPKFAVAKPAGDGVAEEGDWSNAQRLVSAQTVVAPAAPAAAAAAAPTKREKPAGTEAPKQKAKIQLNLVFYDEADRRAQRSRPMRDDAEGARPQRRFDRDRRQSHPQQQQAAAAATAVAPVAKEEFPVLK